MKKQITQNEYLQLVGLFVLSRKHNIMIQDIGKSISEIIGAEIDENGWLNDFVSDELWDENGDADSLLSKLKIKTA